MKATFCIMPISAVSRLSTYHTVRRIQSHVLRAPSSNTTVCPGEFVELDIPEDIQDDILALEPRIDSPGTWHNKASNI